MSHRDIYKCDRCGAEQDSYEQMWRVSVFCSHLPVDPNRYTDQYAGRNAGDWCRKCVDEVDLLGVKLIRKDAKPDSAITLEDMIREIIRNEVYQS